MKSLIRSFSVPTEVVLVLFLSCGLAIAGSLIWIINHVWPPVSITSPPREAMRLDNGGIAVSAVMELLQLAVVLWIGRIRGWSFKTFGFRISWKWTAAGTLLFVVAQTANHI